MPTAKWPATSDGPFDHNSPRPPVPGEEQARSSTDNPYPYPPQTTSDWNLSKLTRNFPKGEFPFPQVGNKQFSFICQTTLNGNITSLFSGKCFGNRRLRLRFVASGLFALGAVVAVPVGGSRWSGAVPQVFGVGRKATCGRVGFLVRLRRTTETG